MSERHLLWLMSVLLLIIGVIGALAFITSGYSVIFLLGTAICITGSFMSFLVGFASN